MGAVLIPILVIVILAAVLVAGGTITGSLAGFFTGQNVVEGDHDNATKPNTNGFDVKIQSNQEKQHDEPQNNDNAPKPPEPDENASETGKISGFFSSGGGSGSSSGSHSSSSGSSDNTAESPAPPEDEPDETYAEFSLNPSETSIANGSDFTVAVDVNTNAGFYAYDVKLYYDNSILYAESVDSSGSFLTANTENPFNDIKIEEGKITVVSSRTGKEAVIGRGTLFTVTFRAIATGDSEITFGKADTGIVVSDTIERPDKTEASGGIVHVS